MRDRSRLALVVVLALAVGIRVAVVPHWPAIENDENHAGAHAASVAERGLPSFTLFNNYLHTGELSFLSPPGLSYALGGWFRLFGVGYRQGRYLYVCAYALGILAAYAMAATAFASPWAGVVAALFAACDRVWIGRVASARPEGLQVALLFCALFLLIKIEGAQTARRALACAVGAGAACGVSASLWLTGFFAIPGLLAAPLLTKSEVIRAKRWSTALGFTAGASIGGLAWGICAVLWPTLMFTQIGYASARAMPTQGVFARLAEQLWLLRIFSPQALGILCAGVAVLATRARPRPWWWTLGVVGGAAPLVILAALSREEYHRALLVPFLVLLQTAGARMLWHKATSVVWRGGLATAVVMSLAVGLLSQPVAIWLSGSAGNDAREGWLSEHISPGAIVLGDPFYFFAVHRAGGTIYTRRYLELLEGVPPCQFTYVFLPMDATGAIKDPQTRDFFAQSQLTLVDRFHPPGHHIARRWGWLKRFLANEDDTTGDYGLWRVFPSCNG